MYRKYVEFKVNKIEVREKVLREEREKDWLLMKGYWGIFWRICLVLEYDCK